MKVLVGHHNDNWCAAFTSRGMAPHSRHNVTTMRMSGLNPAKIEWDDYDVVYLHSSRLCRNGVKWKNDHSLSSSTVWVTSVRGWPAYKRYHAYWKHYDGLSVPNERLSRMVPNHPKSPYDGYVGVCHQGVDPEIFKPMPELRAEEFTIIWGGNPRRSSKRYEMFLDLPYQKKAAGPYVESHSGGCKCGRLYEHDTELPMFYNLGWLYVQPARNDAFSACPLEAAFCGVPVVGFTGLAARGGNGIEEYIPSRFRPQTHSIKGDENDRKALIAVIEELKNDDDLREHYADTLRGIVVSRFSHEKVAKEYDELFERSVEMSRMR